MALKFLSTEYDSSFEDEEDEGTSKKIPISEYKPPVVIKGRPSKEIIEHEANIESRRNYQKYFAALNAYDRHKILINQYLLYHQGATAFLKRDTSKDKRDIDVIKENHQFLWDADSSIQSWEKKLAKKYYDKLFKEYCICDLSKYKEGQVGMRWRMEKEVINGKGQFVCGNKICSENENIRTWEMNFGYVEHGAKKNALVKLRLCHNCSYKLNYKVRRKEVRKRKSSKLMKPVKEKRNKKISDETNSEKAEETTSTDETKEETAMETEQNIWKEPVKVVDEKEREEEFAEYLEDLFL